MNFQMPSGQNQRVTSLLSTSYQVIGNNHLLQAHDGNRKPMQINYQLSKCRLRVHDDLRQVHSKVDENPHIQLIKWLLETLLISLEQLKTDTG